MATIDLYLSRRDVFDGDRLATTCEDWSYGPRPAETYVGINGLVHVRTACLRPTHRAAVPDGSRWKSYCVATVLDLWSTAAGRHVGLDADALVKLAAYGVTGVLVSPVPPPRSCIDGSSNDPIQDADEDRPDAGDPPGEGGRQQARRAGPFRLAPA